MNRTIAGILRYFPPRLIPLIEKNADAPIREIRLRKEKPLTLRVGEKNRYLLPDARLCDDPFRGVRISSEELSDIFCRLCDNSVYAYADAIRSGYITLPNGCRVGLAGRIVTEKGEIRALRDLTSLVIRIAGEWIGCSDTVFPFFYQNGSIRSGLIIGPPGSGKTSLLRDLSRRFSYLGKAVCVIDEREEIAPGAENFDLGPNCDILRGGEKGRAMLMALRALAPELIVADELGDTAQAKAASRSLGAGVPVILSMHAGGLEEALRRPQLGLLSAQNAFGTFAVLAPEPGKGCRVYQRKERIGADAEDIGRDLPFGNTRLYRVL